MIRHLCLAPLLAMLTCLGGGCAAVGLIAAAAPPPTVNAAYTGLPGQKVGVMVWADRAIRIDFPAIQLDMAASVQQILDQSDASETEGIKWVDARSIVRFQQDHPELDGSPVEEIAPLLGVSRLIYVEIQDFQTRSHQSMDLYRGTMNVSVRVIEVSDAAATTQNAVGANTKVGFREDDIITHFPPEAPEEGILNTNDYVIYAGTVKRGAALVSIRFIPHQQEK